MTVQAPYFVYANGRESSRHSGLIAACAVARDAADRQRGITFRVERETDGVAEPVLEATYKHDGRRLVAWMR